MRNLLILFLPFILANVSCKSNTEMNEITTYYFIRHAEKNTSDPANKDPELIEAGIRRAENWARVFKDIPFDAIYSSDFKRTRDTAKRVADAQQKEVDLYNASKLNDEDFQENTKGKTVLVVGHSDSNPKFINYILEEEKYKDIPDEESGSLFIVTILPDGKRFSKVLYIN